MPTVQAPHTTPVDTSSIQLPSYQVVHGDTLSAIAARHDVSLSELLAANPQIVNPNLIYPGDSVALPPPGNVAIETPLADGETATSNLSLSAKGLDLIKGFEGLRLAAYQDSAGIWTIGYGHTAGVKPGQTISHAQADAFLRADVAWAEQAVRDRVSVPLSQDQFDALVSFTFNVGPGALAESTLLRKLNGGDYAGAQAEFGRWVHAGGVRLEGLVRRRAEEAALFGGQAPGTSAPPTPTTHQVASGDSMSAIAQQHGLSLADLIAANPQITNPNLIYPGQELNLPVAQPSSNYTVRSGDTLSQIAAQHGVSLAALIAANPQIANPNLIQIGQQIAIPAGSTTAAPPTTPPTDTPPSPPTADAIQYAPYTVYSTGDQAAVTVSDPADLQPHHDYQTRVRDGQTLSVFDIVLHRTGQAQTAQAVPAPVSGEVIHAGPLGSAGNAVILRGDSGELVYLFHFSSVDVQVGQRVGYGQDLGNQGSTGNSTGPHVHIEAPQQIIDRWVTDLLDGVFDGS